MYRLNKRYSDLSILVENIDTQISKENMKHYDKNSFNDLWTKTEISIDDVKESLYNYINNLDKKYFNNPLSSTEIKLFGNNIFLNTNPINSSEINNLLKILLEDILLGKIKKNTRYCKGLLTNNYIGYADNVVVKFIIFKRDYSNAVFRASDHTIKKVLDNFVKEVVNQHIVYNNYTYIIKYLNYIVRTPKIITFGVYKDNNFPMNTVLFIIMERIRGKTLNYIENTRTNIDNRLYKAISYSSEVLNNDSIFHNDLNKNNILIDKLNNIFLIDWGESTIEKNNSKYVYNH